MVTVYRRPLFSAKQTFGPHSLLVPMISHTLTVLQGLT